VYTELLVFACNWDGWSCIETATNLGLSYPASVKVVRVSCISRINVGLILKAFEFGAAGVMLLGCEQGKCHFGVGSEYITREYEKARRILNMLGIWEGRLILVQIPAFDGHEFVRQVTKLITEITQIPSPKYARGISPRPAQYSKVDSYL